MKLLVLLYSVVAYAAFVASSAWAVFFLAGADFLPSVDSPASSLPAWAALAVNALLLLAFAVQHTVMARGAFKARLTRLIPASAERSTYVLAASLLLLATFWLWQPVTTVVWHVPTPWSVLIWVVYALGWALVVWSTFMVSHSDFLGLRQAYDALRRRTYQSPEFSQRWLYKWIRHPMMLGLLIAFWATPFMTVGHLFFALASSAYIAVGIRFEERDLRTHLGAQYAEYADRVPAVVPLPQRVRAGGPRSATEGR